MMAIGKQLAMEKVMTIEEMKREVTGSNAAACHVFCTMPCDCIEMRRQILVALDELAELREIRKHSDLTGLVHDQIKEIQEQAAEIKRLKHVNECQHEALTMYGQCGCPSEECDCGLQNAIDHPDTVLRTCSEAALHQQRESDKLTAEIKRLRKLIRGVYQEGFADGRGKVYPLILDGWIDSMSREALEADHE